VAGKSILMCLNGTNHVSISKHLCCGERRQDDKTTSRIALAFLHKLGPPKTFPRCKICRCPAQALRTWISPISHHHFPSNSCRPSLHQLLDYIQSWNGVYVYHGPVSMDLMAAAKNIMVHSQTVTLICSGLLRKAGLSIILHSRICNLISTGYLCIAREIDF